MNIVISSSRFARCLRVQSLFGVAGVAAVNVIHKHRVKKRIKLTKGKIEIVDHEQKFLADNTEVVI